MMKAFLVCPVRDGKQEFSEEYCKALEATGWKVYWPPRDTNQNDKTGYRICQDNLDAMKAADIVFIAWDGLSKGVLFDAGMAFALKKPIAIFAIPPLKGSKSFQDMLKDWEEESEPDVQELKAALELMEVERDEWCMDWETASAELLNTRSKLTRVTIQRNLARQGRTEQVERVRFLSKEIARAHPHICYICAHCGDFASTLLDAVDLIDSGTTLVCNRCGMSTVIDLSTPEDRAESYRVAEARGMLGALNAMQK